MTKKLTHWTIIKFKIYFLLLSSFFFMRRVNCSKSICSNLDCSTLFSKMSSAICAVVNLGLKLASGQNDMYGILSWLLGSYIYFWRLLDRWQAIEIILLSSFLSRWILSKWPISFFTTLLNQLQLTQLKK
jgi:hypothetical protein